MPHSQAKADVDAAAFSRYTCAEFIDADMSQRNQTSVQNLLETYQRAKKYVPVQFIDNPRVIGATSTGTTGKIEVVLAALGRIARDLGAPTLSVAVLRTCGELGLSGLCHSSPWSVS